MIWIRCGAMFWIIVLLSIDVVIENQIGWADTITFDNKPYYQLEENYTANNDVIFQDGNKTAKLYWKDGKLTFEGDYTMASQKFADYLTNEMILRGTYDPKQIQEVIKHAELLETINAKLIQKIDQQLKFEESIAKGVKQ